MERILPFLAIILLHAPAAFAAQSPTTTCTPTAVSSPTSRVLVPVWRAPRATTPMLDPFGLALGVMKAQRASDLPRDFRYLAGDDAYYRNLNRGLDGALGLTRKEPTDAEKRWAVVGAAVGYSCAAIAAAEALEIIPDKKKKKK